MVIIVIVLSTAVQVAQVLVGVLLAVTPIGLVVLAVLAAILELVVLEVVLAITRLMLLVAAVTAVVAAVVVVGCLDPHSVTSCEGQSVRPTPLPCALCP